MSGKNILLAVATGICIAGGVRHWFRYEQVELVSTAKTLVVAPKGTGRSEVGIQGGGGGVMVQPAVSFASILAADPEDREARAAGVLMELCRTGQFQAAFDLAGKAPAGLQAGFYGMVCHRWAQSRPQEAVAALAGIADGASRSAALRAVADGWNVNDPGGLAVYASALPASGDRDYALSEALVNWSLQDPAGMATWLNTVPPGNEFDAGAAMVIARTDAANRSPELAMQWVENIENPTLKQNAFQRVVTEWAQADAAAARKYVEQAAWLDEGLRGKAMEALGTAAP